MKAVVDRVRALFNPKNREGREPNSVIFLVRAFIRKFLRDDGLTNATLLSYISIISFVPIVSLILVIVIKFLIRDPKQMTKISEFIFLHFIPETGKNVYDYILGVINESGYLVSAFGVLLVLFAVASIIRTLQASLDRIWGGGEKRSFLKRYFLFWMFLLAAIFLVALLSMFPLAYNFLFPEKFSPQEAEMIRYGTSLLGLVITYLIFFFLYFSVPTGNIPLKSALLGAAFGTALWYLFKWGFSFYIAKFASYDKIYGSLGTIPVFLLWIYLMWMNIILGCEFTYFAAYYKNILKTKGFRASDVKYHNYYLLDIMKVIYERYRNGEGSVSIVEIINAIDYPYTETLAFIRHLIKLGILVRTQKQDHVIPGRDLGRVNILFLFRVLSNGRYEVPEEKTSPFDEKVRDIFNTLKKHEQATFGDMHFADFFPKGTFDEQEPLELEALYDDTL